MELVKTMRHDHRLGNCHEIPEHPMGPRFNPQFPDFAATACPISCTWPVVNVCSKVTKLLVGLIVRGMSGLILSVMDFVPNELAHLQPTPLQLISVVNYHIELRYFAVQVRLLEWRDPFERHK